MRNYLRVRGEYRSRSSGVRSRPELPPRARRIPLPAVGGERHPGTTSACAENTAIFWLGKPRHGNYLRVRGEYFQAAEASGQELELPPRARRIHALPLTQFPQRGTTSACAENTYGKKHVILAMRNYLRVRGEYPVDAPLPPAWAELPPRARRIHTAGIRTTRTRGTTSACAENTSWRRGRRFGWRNYLRVRGEYIPRASERPERGELPPRARRIRDKVYAAADGKGTTSACAENTPATGGSCTQNWNYLRVRGEYFTSSSP